MSEIRVNTIKSEDGASPISFNKGINVTGVATATSFVGALTGNVTGNVSGSSGSATGNAGGLTGTPDISVKGVNSTGIVTAVMFSGNVTGTAATFSGNMNVGGTLTYEDVANIDSLGIVTARVRSRSFRCWCYCHWNRNLP